MSGINSTVEVVSHTPDLLLLVEKKTTFFQEMLQKTIMHVHRNKILEVLGVSDVKICIDTVHDISGKLNIIIENISTMTTDSIINELQNINNDLSGLLRVYGSDSLDDLLSICFGGNTSIVLNNDQDVKKFELLKKYFHPTSYKVINTKAPENTNTTINTNMNTTINTNANNKTKSVQFMNKAIQDKSKNLDCGDISLSVKSFHMKVHGIKLYIHNSSFQKNLLIYGLLDDIHIDLLNNKYLNDKKKQIIDFLPKDSDFHTDTFNCYLSSLTLKDYLCYTYTEIHNKYIGNLNQNKILYQKTLPNIVKDFISNDMFSKRNILIHLLVNSSNYENKYMAYLLYDLLSNDSNGTIDTHEQITLFDSFPWSIKKYFQDAMKKTIQYTNSLHNFDINKIPMEQQICLLKVSDTVKEKAMTKLKELKAKSEDSGSKARQYLDGLLKIPFNLYIKEPVMSLMEQNQQAFQEIVKYYKQIQAQTQIQIQTQPISLFQIKEKYTTLEIAKYVKVVKNSINTTDIINEKLKNHIKSWSKTQLVTCIGKINDFIYQHNLTIPKLKYSQKKLSDLVSIIISFINDLSSTSHNNIIHQLIDENIEELSETNDLNNHITTIESNFEQVSSYIKDVKSTLDKAVHGHDKAKKQIERIIAQWINGDLDGYCFGFEGPPGVGKTSLAKKGLAHCLRDASGNCRPFSMIQMGGDSNGSSLHGHNYTYVGSTWGGIVQILIDKKCMNPIIFIDEVDKISKTENGREIIGILTHLLDATQNDSFQDKYFAGIDLDLSKALFVLSYNDVDAIDKILLDRIHRIKFSNLSLEEKLTILNTHMLPEIYKKMGLENMILFEDSVLKYIIEEYTAESGVRKLKELLFDIIGEINLDILKNTNKDYNFPINISIQDITTKYFKDKPEVRIKKIHTVNQIGIANGMYANSLGQGGVIPVQGKFFPCDKFLDLKITGLVGDVMNESCNVALSLAWELTPIEQQERIREKYNGSQKYGIHANFPEGSVNKNGPSAGSCITTVIYSLLNNKKIKYNVAMTGEISLDGYITAIGGLDYKILGSIKSGVTEFLYPEENNKEFTSFIDKYKDTDILKGILFHPVNHIDQVFEKVFE